MSKGLFEIEREYDLAADVGRWFVRAVVVVVSLIFCAGMVVGALAFGGLS